MEKKTILVGMSGRNEAFRFMNIVIDSLNSRGIDIVRIDHDIIKFETHHTKVWFVYSVGQIIHRANLEIDAIFGEVWGELLKRAKTDAVIGCEAHIGLVDYIWQVENEATKSYRALSMIDEMHTYPCDVDPKMIFAVGRRNGKTLLQTTFANAIYGAVLRDDAFTTKYVGKWNYEKGENNMDGIMNDIAHGKSTYLVTDHGRVPVRIDNLTTNCGGLTEFEGRVLTPAESYMRRDVQTLADIAKGLLARCSTPKTSVPGIKTVHFSGPCTVVIWEDKTKTIVRCKDGEKPDYEKGLAMAIAKKAMGTNESGSNYYDIFKKWMPKPEEEETNKEA